MRQILSWVSSPSSLRRELLLEQDLVVRGDLPSPAGSSLRKCSSIALSLAFRYDVGVLDAGVLRRPGVVADLEAGELRLLGVGEGPQLLHVLGAVVDHLELELRGLADEVLDALEVRLAQAGQLDDDVVLLALIVGSETPSLSTRLLMVSTPWLTA